MLNDYVYKCSKKNDHQKVLGVHTDPNDTYLCGVTAEQNHEPNPRIVTPLQIRYNVKERAVNEVIPIAMVYE